MSFARSIAKSVLPPNLLYGAAGAYASVKTRGFKSLLRNHEEANYLEAELLPQLDERFSEPDKYAYDKVSTLERGNERARSLKSLLPRRSKALCLELGCWDGMVCCSLRRAGHGAVGIDNRSSGFDERAAQAGVQLIEMDAARLEFPNDAFDLVFSYDAFEHFEEPAAVFREAIRVTKPGGAIFLDFGPLYNSPFGLHAYRSVTVPYCQFLFQRRVLEDFCAAMGRAPIEFASVNGWSLAQFRQLWHDSVGITKIARYERRDLSGLEIVKRFPACFSARNLSADELTVSSIQCQLRVQ